MNIDEIKEDMKVVGSDNQHVGTVDKIEGTQIKLTKNDSDNGKHNFISVGLVERVDGNSVKLSSTASETKSQFSSDSAFGSL